MPLFNLINIYLDSLNTFFLVQGILHFIKPSQALKMIDKPALGYMHSPYLCYLIAQI